MNSRKHASNVALAAAAAVLSLLAPLAGPAHAQSDDAPTHLVVTNDEAPLRCRAGLDWYMVARMDVGQVLRARGSADGWYRVEYPQGLTAAVRTDRSELRDAQNVVVLTANASLSAYNLLVPYADDCYMPLFEDSQLPLGTALEYLGPLDNRQGQTVKHRVVAPPGAQGYIAPSDVRPATAQEIADFEGITVAQEEAVDAAPEAFEPEPAVETPTTTTAQRDEPQPRTTTQARTDDDAFTTPRPDDRPSSIGGEAGDEPASNFIASLEDLDGAYERVINQPIETAEFSQLISQYEALRLATPSGQEGDVARDFIDARLELLEIRAEVQNDMRELAALSSEAESASIELTHFLQQVQRARGYVVVGRLALSLIYDGDRLPRLYRVVAADAAGGGRTLAYVLPSDDVDLLGRVGAIVGILGEDDPTARRGEVRVIKPTACEILNAE